jgi:hypothetical protein
MTGTHPTLYRILDNVIRLNECEVYSYQSDIESDPHADDVDEDEDEVRSVSDEDSSSEDDGATFEFDDYDVDEVRPSEHSSWRTAGRTSSTDSESTAYAPYSIHTRRRGALLWSSHWFFLNRKMKRILFISVWARTKTPRLWIDDEFAEPISIDEGKNERFFGWEGAVGAGARAMGLGITV